LDIEGYARLFFKLTFSPAKGKLKEEELLKGKAFMVDTPSIPKGENISVIIRCMKLF